MTFTPERIARLRKILAKATPGEWASNSKKEFGPVSVADDQSYGMTIACGDAYTQEDASAIPVAINTLPAALDEIERLGNTIHARSYEHGLADSRGRVKVLESQLSRVTAERDSLIDQVKAMTGVSAELSHAKAERDEAVAEVKRLRGSLEYIKAQSVSKAYATSPAMALNVIRANAEAALDNDFQTTVAEARSFLSRMGGRK